MKDIKLVVQPVLKLVIKNLHFVQMNVLPDAFAVVWSMFDRTIMLIFLAFILMNAQKMIDTIFY
jgi:hypothetical protein